MKRSMLHTFGLASAMLTTCVLAQAEKSSLEVLPPLASDSAVLAKLEALGENSAVLIGKPTIVEELGDFAKGWHKMKESGPGARNYCLKMAWMGDRKRAFFCGANHGSPHRFNDAWEYDLAANSWALLYVPDYNDRGAITDYDREVLVLDNGWLRTRKGGPAHPGHTWWGLTYDPNIRAAVWQCGWPGYRLADKLEAINKSRDDLYKGPPIWCFYPYEGKWEPLPTSEPWPANPYGSSLEYVPAFKGELWQYQDKSWLLNGSTRSWKQMEWGGERVPSETLTYHDTKRQMMVAYNGPLKDKSYATWHLSLVEGAQKGWVRQTIEQDEFPVGHDARSFLYYDPVGAVGLLYDISSKAIWLYNPDQASWKKLTPQGTPPPFGEKERVMGYMDPARNVFVVIGFKDVWCYRYKVSDEKPTKW